MKNVTIRYFALIGGLLFFFAGFIACGSQLYQVSLEKDFDDERVSEEGKNPNSTAYGIHATDGWKSLPVQFRFASDMNAMQKVALTRAMKSWEKVTGKSLFEFIGIDQGKTGDSFPDLYSSLKDGINGYYLDHDWAKTAKPVVVLATTIWDNVGNNGSQISGADIRFNSENYTIGDSLFITAVKGKEVVDMESLALHELGHLLGLAHVDAEHDPVSIMNPQLFIGEGLTSRKVSRSDIERIQQIYGCEGSACDIDATLEEVELNLAKETGGTTP